MIGHITHLHHHYRLATDAGTPSATAARLDHLVNDRLANSLAVALDQAIGDDPTVYVLRNVQAQFTLALGDDLSDVQLVQKWAERLAGTVVRQIARTPNDGTNQIRFADQAEYVTQYVVDLLHGRTTQRWYYSAFDCYLGKPLPDALRSILLDHRPHLPAILRNLHDQGALDTLLAQIDQATLQTIWREGLGGQSALDLDAIYPLFAQVFTLIDRLAMWQHGAPDATALFPIYLATAGENVDWRDRTSLTNALLAVLHFLRKEGYLKSLATSATSVLAARLDQILLDFDWLQTEQLRDAFLAMYEASFPAFHDLPVREANSPATPRQQALVANLLAALTQGQISLEGDPIDSFANALRLYTLLIAHAPRWIDDPLATSMIQQLLRACRWVSASQQSDTVLQHLRLNDMAGALNLLPEANRNPAAAAFAFLGALHESGLKLSRRLIDTIQLPICDTHKPSDLSQSLGYNGTTELLGLLTTLDDTSLAVVLAASSDELSEQALDRLVAGLPNLASTGTAYALGRFLALDAASRAAIRNYLSHDLTGQGLDAVLHSLSIQQHAKLVEALNFLDQLDAVNLSLVKMLVNHDHSPATLDQAFQLLPTGSRSKAREALQALVAADRSNLRKIETLIQDTNPATVLLQQGIYTECAGAYLLLRAIADVQLPRIVNTTNFLPNGEPKPLGSVLVALALRWAGAPGVSGDQVDPGLWPLTGSNRPISLTALRDLWAAIAPSDHTRFQTALLRMLAGQRLLRAEALHLHKVRLPDGTLVLVAGDDSGSLWPFGCVLDESIKVAAVVATWLDDWQAATGRLPQLVVPEELAIALSDWPGVVVVPAEEDLAIGGADSLISTHFASREAFVAMCAAMAHGQIALPSADLTLTLTANTLLRIWARWLGRFADSGAPYLLTNFIRRPGWVVMNDKVIRIQMATMPLDMVLTFANYTDNLEKVFWLEKRDIHFVLRDE